MRIERIEFNKVELTWKPNDQAPEIIPAEQGYKIELRTRSFGPQQMLSDSLVSEVPILINGEPFDVRSSAICIGGGGPDTFYLVKAPQTKNPTP